MNVGVMGKYLIFVFPIFFHVVAEFIRRNDPNLFLSIWGFEQIGEWVQFWAYLVASSVSFIAYVRSRAVDGFRFLERNWLLLFSVFLFFVAGEEINWGQMIFDWETFGVFAEINIQNQTNFHNIEGFQGHLAYMVVGLAGSISFILRRFLRGQRFAMLLPGWEHSLYFFQVFAFYFYFDFIRPFLYIYGNEQELFEMILSFGFLLVSISNLVTVFRLEPKMGHR